MEIGIIGFGEFGEFLFDLAKVKFPDAKIKVYSRSHKPNKSKFFDLVEVCKCNLVIPCVPISTFEKVISDIVPLIPPTSLLIEVCSVKVHPVKILSKYSAKINYIATHPMFGPNSFKNKNYDLTNKRMILTEHNLKETTYKDIVSLLKESGLEVVECSAHEHDQLAAETQFLTHLIGQVFQQLKSKKTKIDTYSYRQLFEVLQIVKAHGKLFEDIYMYNPYAKAELNKFEDAFEKIKSKLKS